MAMEKATSRTRSLRSWLAKRRLSHITEKPVTITMSAARPSVTSSWDVRKRRMRAPKLVSSRAAVQARSPGASRWWYQVSNVAPAPQTVTMAPIR